MRMDSTEEFRLRPKKDYLPVISNLTVTLLLVGVLSAAFYRYNTRMADISLSESRYLTTEWRLLQELKQQTDEQLQEKDQEIVELNERYRRLARDNASSSELRQIEIQLQQAKVERDEIATRRAEVQTEKPAAPEQTWMKELLPSESQSALAKLLQKRLETSEAERDSQRQRIEALEKAIAELDAAGRAGAAASALQIAAGRETILRLADALADIERKALEGEGAEHPRMEDLGSWALVRALASSPEIRSEYPTLLDSLDRYLETYGRLERVEGRREAYSSAASVIKQLIP